MASEIANVGESFLLKSFIRGYHVYHITWTHSIGKVLQVKREVDNKLDYCAVLIVKNGVIARHLSWPISVFLLLQHDGNTVFCEITGKRLNHCVQLEVKVPRAYKFFGQKSHIDKLKELLVGSGH